MGIFKKVKAPDLRGRGRPARARIASTELLNRGEFQVSGTRAQDLLTGGGTMTTVRFELDVAVDGAASYRVKVKQPVPTMLFARMVAGTEVGVLVDPDDARHVEIDFDAPIVEESLEDRAKHDPTLQALLDRRVDPPAE
jgi:hypothetical protein